MRSTTKKKKTLEERTAPRPHVEQQYMPGRNGGRLHRGSPNRKIRSGGRPPKKFRNLCRQLLAKEYTTRNIRKILAKGESSRDFQGMLQFLARYGYHELTQTKDMKLSAGSDLLALLHEAAQAKEEK